MSDVGGVGGSGGGDRGRRLRKRPIVNPDINTYSGKLRGRPTAAFPQARADQSQRQARILEQPPVVDIAQQSPVRMSRQQSPETFAPPSVHGSFETGCSPMATDEVDVELELEQMGPMFQSGAPSIRKMTGSSTTRGRRKGSMSAAPFQALHQTEAPHDEKREDEEDEEEDIDRGLRHRLARAERGGPGRGRGRGEGGDPVWRAMDAVPGGPTILEPLSGFLGHIAHVIWNGEEREVLTCHSGADRIASWIILSADTLNLINRTSLAHLKECMFQHLNMPLISAFVERWHPETNSFHMPFGEMTITLHDVFYILRLPVTGNPLIGDTPVSSVKCQLASLLGMSMCDVNGELKSSGIRFRTLQERLSPEEIRPAPRAIGYMLWLLGATLFLDKSSTRLSVHYLPFLTCLDDVPGYAWGAATLAYLYRQLGISSRADTQQIAGCLTLLQTWIYEYFPAFRPSRRDGWTPNTPCSLRWAPTSTPRVSQIALLEYRRMLDRMSVDAVTWTPFGKNPSMNVPITLFSGIIHCRTITEPYMPDRCLRQFGYVQVIPTQVFIPRKVYRGRKTQKYICDHDVMLRSWQEWRHMLVNLSGIGSSKASFPNQVVDGYLPWFRERSHLRVSPPQGDSNDAVDDDNQGDVLPQHMPDAARLQWIAARMKLLDPERRQEMDETKFWETLDDVCIHMRDLF